MQINESACLHLEWDESIRKNIFKSLRGGTYRTLIESLNAVN